MRYFVYDETYWLSSVVVASTLAFDYFSKEWMITPPKRRSLKRRVATLYMCGFIYLTLFASYFYFNGKITDSEGDEVPVYEALTNAFKSPWWTDLKSSFSETWRYAQHNGYYETWKQIIDLLDADGEQNAYKVNLSLIICFYILNLHLFFLKVLGLLPTASQSEITSAFRKLSRENHPDKVKGSLQEKRLAEERFMEITHSYEILSKLKSKRRQKNKKSANEEQHSETITL